MISRLKSSRALVGEIVFLAVLFAVWLAIYFGLTSSLTGLSPAGRALYLVTWFTDGSLWVGFVLMTIAALLVPVRHVNPVFALIAASLCITVVHYRYPLLGTNSVVQFVILAALASWAAWKVERWWFVIPVLALPIVALGIRTFQINDRFEAINAAPSTSLLSASRIAQEVMLYVVAVGIGLAVRRLGEQSAELEERNAELLVERANTAVNAVVGERLRISRELHDVVAHHVTTMTVHAGAARQLIDTAPEKATDSLLHIESAGRSAVNELHQLLGYLRGDQVEDGTAGVESDKADRAPTPSLKHLELLRTSVGGELDCRITIDGNLDMVPPAVDVSAYRIIQEAVTNSLKHSSAKAADVHVTVLATAVELSVIDQGSKKIFSTNAGGKEAAGGHGVVGMRERAMLHGGHLEVGPVDSTKGGGWKVHAVLPFGAS